MISYQVAYKGIFFQFHHDSSADINADFVFISIDLFQSQAKRKITTIEMLEKLLQSGGNLLLIVVGEFFELFLKML